MTKEQLQELQVRQSQKYLTYCALQEIMLDNYEDCTWLKAYDSHLLIKHKNIINTLQKKANDVFKFIQGYEEGEETVRQFHNFVKIHEGLHQAIESGGDTLTRCLNEIEKILLESQIIQE